MHCVKKNVVALIRADESAVATATAWEAPDIQTAIKLEPEEPELSEEELALQQAFEDAYREGQEKGRAEGYEKGYEEGYRQGHELGHSEGLQAETEAGQQQREEIRQQVETLFEPLTPLLEGLHNPLETQLDETVNRAIASLVVQIARQVINNELLLKPEHIIGVINDLFQQLPMTEREVRLCLHPEDKALIESGLEFSAGGFRWKMEGDEQITRGGCRIDSHHFSADETVERRLQQSVKQIFGSLDLELDQPQVQRTEIEEHQSPLPETVEGGVDKIDTEIEAGVGEGQSDATETVADVINGEASSAAGQTRNRSDLQKSEEKRADETVLKQASENPKEEEP